MANEDALSSNHIFDELLLNIANLNFQSLTNNTNSTSTDSSLPTDDQAFIISLSISIFLFLLLILVSCFTGPRRVYFPCADETHFGISWLYGASEVWSPLIYFQTIRGSEYFLIYIWILKDFFWTQDNYFAVQICGISAVVISFLLAVRSAVIGHYREVFINITTSLWLMGNFWWMEGEITDYQYPDNPDYPVYPTYSEQAHDILISAACVLGVYYLIIRPFGLLKPSQEISDLYNENQLESPFPLLFPLYRDYENFHMVVWLGKDIAWNGSACENINNINWSIMWNIFTIPTILIGIHFVILTFSIKLAFIDHIHYIILFLWVSANIVWAFAELYSPLGSLDDAVPLLDTSTESYEYLRWWSGWTLIVDIMVVILLYVYWISATYLGWIEIDKNEVTPTVWSGDSESPLLESIIKNDGDE